MAISEKNERFASSKPEADPIHAINDAMSSAGEFYERANHWISENIGSKNAGLIAAVTVAGLVGFFIGRGSSQSPTDLDAY